MSPGRPGASPIFVAVSAVCSVAAGLAAAFAASGLDWVPFRGFTFTAVWLWLAWLTVSLVAMIVAARRLFSHRHLIGLAWLCVPVLAALMEIAGWRVGDALRFAWYKSTYDAVVASAKAGKCSGQDLKARGVAVDSWDCDDPITIVFPWDGFLSQWWGVVYDAADEFAKRPRKRIATWTHRRSGEFLSCSWASFGVGHHYYIAYGDYGTGPNGCD
jgi:hypothetical protein